MKVNRRNFFKGTLLWDGRRVTNNEKANEFLDKPYREGLSPFV